jgi:Leucine-rich repeat (LRR) protein
MLDLSHNQIKELPMELSMCTSLEVRHIKRGPKALSLKGGKMKKEFRVEI